MPLPAMTITRTSIHYVPRLFRYKEEERVMLGCWQAGCSVLSAESSYEDGCYIWTLHDLRTMEAGRKYIHTNPHPHMPHPSIQKESGSWGIIAIITYHTRQQVPVLSIISVVMSLSYKYLTVSSFIYYFSLTQIWSFDFYTFQFSKVKLLVC